MAHPLGAVLTEIPGLLVIYHYTCFWHGVQQNTPLPEP